MRISNGTQTIGGGSVTVTIDAPSGSGLVARSTGGDIRIEHVTTTAGLHTSGGNVHIGTAQCPVDARTSGGNVTLTTAADVSEDHLTWRTSGGNVRVNDTKCKNKSSV